MIKASGEHQIEFQPLGRRGPCSDGETLLDCARRLGVALIQVCGGAGKCRSCKIRVLEGSLSEVTSVEQEAFTGEELESGWRLACRTYAKSDCRVHVPPESLSTPQRLQIEGLEIDSVLDPPITSMTCEMEPPTLTRPVADAENLLEKAGALGLTHVDFYVLMDLSTRLREWNWTLTARIRDRELISVSPPGSRAIGLAVDLGTT